MVGKVEKSWKMGGLAWSVGCYMFFLFGCDMHATSLVRNNFMGFESWNFGENGFLFLIINIYLVSVWHQKNMSHFSFPVSCVLIPPFPGIAAFQETSFPSTIPWGRVTFGWTLYYWVFRLRNLNSSLCLADAALFIYLVLGKVAKISQHPSLDRYCYLLLDPQKEWKYGVGLGIGVFFPGPWSSQAYEVPWTFWICLYLSHF